MKVEVKLLNDKGRPVPPAALRLQKRYIGELALAEVRSAEFGRILVAADLLSSDKDEVLPRLHDAVVLRVEGERLRIRGFETANGVQHGQTWDVKVLAC